MDISTTQRSAPLSLPAFADRLLPLMASLMTLMVRRDHNYLARGLITFPQLMALRLLEAHPDTPMHVLAATLDCTGSTATGLVDRLVRLGLARRRAGTADRRAVLADITPKGRRILREFREEKRAMILDTFRHIAPVDRARYLDTLAKIATILGARTAPLRARRRTARLGALLAAGLAAGMAAAGSYRAPTPAEAAVPTGFDRAVYAAGAAAPVTLPLHRADCLAYALDGNLGLRVRRLDPVLRTGDLVVARAAFEPSLVAGAKLADSTERSATLMSSNVAHSRQADASFSLTGLLPLGTRYDLGLRADKLTSSSTFQTINPAFHAEPQVTLTQPLLRGAGLAVNRAAIRIARTQLQMSDLQVRETAMDVVSRTLAAYAALYDARARHAIELEALDRTERLLAINRERYAKGLISSVDLLETETAVAARRKVLIETESALQQAEDALKLVTNLVRDPARWNARIDLLDAPELNVQSVDLVASLERAFSNRPDYAARKLALANQDVQIEVARNARLPTVDLVGSFGLNGLDDHLQGAFDGLRRDYKDWMVGVQVTIPWGRGDRATYARRQWEKIQALLDLQRFEQTMILEVRDRVREVGIQYRQAEAARLSADLETRHLAAQQDRYGAGQVSTHDMLDYQNRLASARRDYAKALLDYQVALIRLDQAEGTTLAKHAITLEP